MCCGSLGPEDYRINVATVSAYQKYPLPSSCCFFGSQVVEAHEPGSNSTRCFWKDNLFPQLESNLFVNKRVLHDTYRKE